MRRSLLLAVFAALTAAASAQDQGQPQFPGFDPGGRTRAWLDEAGAHWRVDWNKEVGTPALLYGGQRPLLPAAQAGDDAALEQAARQVVDELAPALGFDSGTLELSRVKRLDHLAQAGTSAKIAVLFRQVTGGVPTWHGEVSVLISTDGRLLAVDNTSLPHVAQIPLVPEISEAAALDAARAAFVDDTGMASASWTRGDYVVFPAPVAAGKRAVRATAAYTFVLDAGIDRLTGATPVIRQYAVAATGAPRVLGSWSLVHNADVTGTVQGWGQVGLLADGDEAEVLHPLQDVRLTGTGLTTTYSAANGSFSFPNVVAPVTVTASFNGEYSRVNNDAGAEASVAVLCTPGVPASFVFNPGQVEQQTAEVNAQTFTIAQRNWLLSIDDDEQTLDFQRLSNVNLNSTCNAYYDGGSTNYYLTGGGCPNSAYATVVWHENGHWLNDLYGSGNDFGGVGEGGADCWAMYQANDPIIAPNFFGPGQPIRTGLNTTPFCGDDNLGCYGESHANGEPLMGAVWKVRANLQAALGQTPGGNVANHLLVAWYQVYNDSLLKSIIETHWLTLDDDDGNIDNGTPHYTQIDAGFVAQGFPGFELALFTIQHTAIVAVNSELPVPIEAVITEENGTLSGATLHWSNNGGTSWNTIGMAALGGDEFKAFVPGQTSPKTVRYYIEGFGPAGSNTLPKAAPAESFGYDVGTLTTQFAYDFEPISDEGWTHAQVLQQDDWQHDTPFGTSAYDPPSAYSGARAWGNDHGPSGFNGNYQPNVLNHLLSPVFNFTGKTNLRLRFQRWLSVEEAIFDQAQIFVNATQIFVNPLNGHLLDAAWSAQDFDIGALANNNPSVQFKFQLTTDGGLEFGGWTIDDFRIVSLGPVSPTVFTEYGTGTPGFGAQAPHLTGSGTASPGGNITIAVSNGRPNATGVLFAGGAQASLPFKGGTFLVASPLALIAVNLGAAGTASLPGVIPAEQGLFGVTPCLQYWCNDAAAVKGAAGSNGLTFTIK
jgi:hypothetical protein